jgi:hypothetical protein
MPHVSVVLQLSRLLFCFNIETNLEPTIIFYVLQMIQVFLLAVARIGSGRDLQKLKRLVFLSTRPGTIGLSRPGALCSFD